MGYYVYVMGNRRPTLYVGVTNDLVRRVYEHRQGLVYGFTKKYGLHDLLYFEEFVSAEDAIVREKQLKHWNREWKLDLIRSINPTLKDLYPEIAGGIPAGGLDPRFREDDTRGEDDGFHGNDSRMREGQLRT